MGAPVSAQYQYGLFREHLTDLNFSAEVLIQKRSINCFAITLRSVLFALALPVLPRMSLKPLEGFTPFRQLTQWMAFHL